MNNKGEVSMLALLIGLVLLTITIALYFQIFSIEKSIANRSQSYLCLRSLIAQHKGLKNSYKKANQKISALNLKIAASIKVPPLHASLKRIKEALITRTNLWYPAYLKRLSLNKECSASQKLINVKLSPIRVKGITPQRDLLGLVVLKNKSRILIKHGGLILQAKEKSSKWKVKEMKMGFNLLKPLSGSASSPALSVLTMD